MKWFFIAIGALWLLKIVYECFKPHPPPPIFPIDLGFSPVSTRAPEPEVPHSEMGDDSADYEARSDHPRDADFLVVPPKELPSAKQRALPPPAVRCQFCSHIFTTATDAVCDHCGALR